MSTVSYKDYQGSVSYENGRLIVQILHIEDTIVGECEEACKVKECFAELVDDYLATCENLGRAPSKPFKGQFNVRISPDLHRQAAMLAAREGTTLNGFVEQALAARVEHVQKPSLIEKSAAHETLAANVLQTRVVAALLQIVERSTIARSNRGYGIPSYEGYTALSVVRQSTH